MPNLPRLLAAALLAAGCAAASAADLEVRDPWVRGTVQAQKASGAFMKLSSRDGVAVVGGESPVAERVEIHEMSMQQNVMRMRAMKRLDIPGGGRVVELAPGGYHVMLLGLRKPLAKGDFVPITLTVEDKDGRRDSVEVKAEVKDLTAVAPAATGGGHDHH